MLFFSFFQKTDYPTGNCPAESVEQGPELIIELSSMKTT